MTENLSDPLLKPSALAVASLRAAHQVLDKPLVFEDPLAFKILATVEQESIRNNSSRYNIPLLKGLRASLVVRSKLAEDEWHLARQRGISQYVILGAGLDTFAYRDRNQNGCRIFEVDLEAMQKWKRSCLRAAGINEPRSLTFVPIDFERSTLAQALGNAGFSADEPAFFSWLGVVVYLEMDSITKTLRFIASLSPGSAVVFDYNVDPELLTAKERMAGEFLAARTAERGEPWKSYFAPASLSEMLYSLGFSEVEDFGPDQLNARYLSGRTDGLHKSGVSRLVCARV